MSSHEDHYKILDASPSASLAEIRVIYRDLAQVWHPDRFPNNPRLREKAEAKLKAINHAYETIRLERRRTTASPKTKTRPKPEPRPEATRSPRGPRAASAPDDAIGKAFGWYARAAEQGHADAQCIIATMYAEGQRMPKDEAKAIEWYRKSAAQGHAAAEFQIGLRYYGGRVLPQDQRKAFTWFEKAALQGHSKAQFYVGIMYTNGESVPQDNVRAVAWYSLAAANGHPDADALREAVANSLTPDQRAAARKLTNELRNRIASRI